MESIKPLLLLVVLSGVGYGVYVALNRAPPMDASTARAPKWNRGKDDDRSGSARPPKQQLGTLATPSTPPSSSADQPGLSSDSGRSTAPPFGAGPGAVESQPAVPPLMAPQSQQHAAAPPQAVEPAAEPNALTPGDGSDASARARHDFATAARSAQSALADGKLPDALRELSRWYDHPAIAPEDQAALLELLSELAGTVIYSREHWLAPPHVVREGETLVAIAGQYSVPWQLLAKINGIADPNQLLPGEELKIVRGPFHAELDRQQNCLTLFVDDLYAGRFQVEGGNQVMQPTGAYPVAKFPADHPSNMARLPYISLGGNLQITVQDAIGGGAAPPGPAIRLSQRDMADVFDILSDRSQVTIRR